MEMRVPQKTIFPFLLTGQSDPIKTSISTLVRFHLSYSKEQKLYNLTICSQKKFHLIIDRSPTLKKSPISEENFFTTMRTMRVWNISNARLYRHLDVKIWFLGKQFLLFTGRTGQADHLIISSHGGYLPGSGVTPVPKNTELVGLGPHGWELMDPKTSNIAKRKILPYSIINAYTAIPTQAAYNPNLFSNIPINTCTYPKPTDLKALSGTKTPGHIKNYTLSKYQKFGFGNESYLDIAHIVNRSRNTIPIVEEMGLQPIDVLTVRNRLGKLNPNLKDVFQALQNQGIHYKRITLGFCRSNMLSSIINPAPIHVAPTV